MYNNHTEAFRVIKKHFWTITVRYLNTITRFFFKLLDDASRSLQLPQHCFFSSQNEMKCLSLFQIVLKPKHTSLWISFIFFHKIDSRSCDLIWYNFHARESDSPQRASNPQPSAQQAAILLDITQALFIEKVLVF